MRPMLVPALLLIAAACAPRQESDFRAAHRAETRPTLSSIDAPHVFDPVTTWGSVKGDRNLFAFVEPPPRPVIVKAAAIVRPRVDATVQPPMSSEIVEAPKPPQFSGTCIGRFGPDQNPLAAFVVGGAIVNARRGEAIGGGFVVRAIGIESIDLEPAGFPGALQRVAIGQASK